MQKEQESWSYGPFLKIFTRKVRSDHTHTQKKNIYNRDWAQNQPGVIPNGLGQKVNSEEVELCENGNVAFDLMTCCDL